MKFLKSKLCIFAVLSIVMFSFTSCFGSGNYTKIVKAFFSDFKKGDSSKLQNYVKESETFGYIKNFVDGISMDNKKLDSKLGKKILEKARDFKYEIIDESKDDNKATVNVKFSYYDLFSAYEQSISEFLSEALDFDNLDKVYSDDYIDNLLIGNIDKLKMQETTIGISLVKEKSWKIDATDTLLDVLTGNASKLFRSLNDVLGDKEQN